MITKSKAILVLNAGSSSVKFSLYDTSDVALSLVARGQIEGIGADARFEARDNQGALLAEEVLSSPGKTDHDEALHSLVSWLQKEFARKFTLGAVGHRMTHGGVDFIEPTLVNDEALERLEALVPLAPLHLPHNLAGVRAVSRLRPELPQVACFDTAFHRNRSPASERFGLTDALFQSGLKRWGFHGLSYESIARQFRNIAPHAASGRVIVAHLGSGASLCAMKAGRSIDTTMGFSTLDGLPMATRCGNLDPGVILYLLRDRTPDDIQSLLYHQSGLLGISGISGDMRTLLASRHPNAAAAIDYFVYRVIREIGALTAVLGGLDALIFTAGIGENAPAIRARICKGLDWLGIALDPFANDNRRTCISISGRSPSVWVLATDEESIIAAHTRALISKLPARTAIRRGGRSVRAKVHG